jgi:hypothetical protein
MEVWIMSDEDEFVAELARRLAPLRGEADVLLDDLLAEIESEAVVVLLPSSRSVAPDVEATPPGRWIWMSAAALLLATLGTSVLVAESRQRHEEPSISVGGDVEEPGARVRIGVRRLSGQVSSAAALVELRALHGPLAACAAGRESNEPLELELTTKVRSRRYAQPGAVHVQHGELDEPTRDCITGVVSDWLPESLRSGVLSLKLEFEPGSEGQAR